MRINTCNYTSEFNASTVIFARNVRTSGSLCPLAFGVRKRPLGLCPVLRGGGTEPFVPGRRGVGLFAQEQAGLRFRRSVRRCASEFPVHRK